MPHSAPLPPELGSAFSVADALRLGATPGRLRSSDLTRNFRGTRSRVPAEEVSGDRFAWARKRERALIEELSQRLVGTQFISHRSAAVLWGAPLPFASPPELHVCALAPDRAPRVCGAVGHRILPERCTVERIGAIPVSSAASTWVMLGALKLSITQLVVAGDHLVRMYRAGYGRPDAGRPPLTSREQLAGLLALGGWSGAPRLRRAWELIREDSWSPRESMLRLGLVQAGLPEPALNVDVFDGGGRFLACLDMAYLDYRVGAEYHGEQHATSYAADVERLARLRADGWIVVEVTRAAWNRSGVVAERVARALRERGWTPQNRRKPGA